MAFPNDHPKPLVAPPPLPRPFYKRRSAKSLGLLLITACLVFLGITSWSTFKTPGPLRTNKPVSISGNTLQVAHSLHQEGIIEHPLLFSIMVYLSGAKGSLKAGEYLFTEHMSPYDVLKLLQSGKVLLHSLTVPEGLTTEQIIDRLNESPLLSGEITKTPPEGTLLPQTYRFPRGETRQALLSLMEKEFSRLITKIWDHRAENLPIKTKKDLVILASIIEKETGVSEERSRVAGVLLNRLNIGMPLQSDPTVIYGLALSQGTPLNKELTKKDLITPNPYNTYLVSGLPPGPICNPGSATLEAASHPEETKDLYFVASPSGVGHIFSTNLKDHNTNVTHWRQAQQTQRKASPPPKPSLSKTLPTLRDVLPALRP
jgi:UPF0755 protein